jgi:proliferating cell nuclear antigen
MVASTDSDRIAEYDMKLMDIDSDTLGIPDTDYDARVTMPSSELTRIVRDLSQLGESVRIEVTKDGVRFVSDGEAANGSVLLKQTEGAARRFENYGKGDDDDDVKDEDEEGGGSKKKKVKKEVEDVEMNEETEDGDEEAEFKANSGDEEGEDEVEASSKKRKASSSKVLYLALLPSPRLNRV